MKFNNWSLSSITGLLAVIIFSVFTFTAAALFPGLVNPLYVWLSNLGNVELNPSGGNFFQLGLYNNWFDIGSIFHWPLPVEPAKIIG